jgi:hypothetical protein
MIEIANYLTSRERGDAREVAALVATVPRREPVASPISQWVRKSGATLLQAEQLVNAIEFPGFVAELMEGVFDAAVDASIEQMHAYAELIDNASKTLDEWTKSDGFEAQARDSVRHDADVADRPVAPAVGKRLATHRQRMLATMLLMGINRIVVTDGEIRAKRLST